MMPEVEERLSAVLRHRAAEGKPLPGIEALMRRERRRRAARISGALVAAVLVVSVPLWSSVQPSTVQFADPLPSSGPAGHWERVRADDAGFGRPGEASGVSGLAAVDDRFVAVGIGGGSDDGRIDAAVWLSDDGRSWRHSASTDAWFAEGVRPEAAVLLSDVATIDEETLVAVGYVNFEPRHAPLAVRSSDSGQTWSAAGPFAGLPETASADLSRITVAPDGTMFALGRWSDEPPTYAADLPAIWSSTAHGDWQRGSWGDVPESTLRGWQLSDLAVGDVARVAVGSSAGGALVVRASSEGAWEEQVVAEEPDAVLSAVTATDGGFIAVGTAGGSGGHGLVVWSDAHAGRWERLDDPEVLGGANLSAVTLGIDGLLVVGGTHQGMSAVWTYDGRAWNRERGDWHPGGITALAANGHGFVAGGYAADDGGSHDAAVWIRGTERTPDGEPHERLDEPFALPRATLLLSTDHALTAIDVARGTSERFALEELAGGDPPHRLTQRGDAVVFFGDSGDTYAATPSALEAPWRLGSSSYYLPSAEPDRVWLVQGNASTQARNEVREVAVDGRITLESRLVPSGTTPWGAVADGLVLVDGSGLQVWDPRSDRAVAEFPGAVLVASHGDLLAWCDRDCTDLHISDLAAGTQVEVAAPRDGRAWSPQGAFAPSGGRLAIPLGSDGREGNELAVIDLDGSVNLVNDSPIAGTPIAWGPYGRWLLAATEDGSLLVHDVEQDQTQLLDLDLPVFHGIAVVDPMGSLGHFGADQGPLGGRLENGLVLSAGGFHSGVVRAVEEGTGRLAWTFDAGDTAFLGPRAGDIVLVAPHNGGLVALNIDSGEQRWSVKLDATEAAGTAAIADDMVYLPTSYPSEGDTTAPRLHALDLTTGERRWVTSLEPGTDLQWHEPVVTEDLVLLTDTLSHPGSAPTSWLHAIDRATGSIAWRFDLDDAEQGFHFQKPLTNADTVYAVSSSGLFAVDLRTGEQRWARTATRIPELLEVTAERLTVVLNGARQELEPSTGESIDVQQTP